MRPSGRLIPRDATIIQGKDYPFPRQGVDGHDSAMTALTAQPLQRADYAPSMTTTMPQHGFDRSPSLFPAPNQSQSRRSPASLITCRINISPWPQSTHRIQLLAMTWVSSRGFPKCHTTRMGAQVKRESWWSGEIIEESLQLRFTCTSLVLFRKSRIEVERVKGIEPLFRFQSFASS